MWNMATLARSHDSNETPALGPGPANAWLPSSRAGVTIYRSQLSTLDLALSSMSRRSPGALMRKPVGKGTWRAESTALCRWADRVVRFRHVMCDCDPSGIVARGFSEVRARQHAQLVCAPACRGGFRGGNGAECSEGRQCLRRCARLGR